MKEIDEKIYERIQLLKWLIMGQNVHCIPVTKSLLITKEWVVKHYNVEMSYFEMPKTMKW